MLSGIKVITNRNAIEICILHVEKMMLVYVKGVICDLKNVISDICLRLT